MLHTGQVGKGGAGERDAGLMAYLLDSIIAHEQLFSYVVSFGGFYLFIAWAIYMANAPGFRRERTALNRLVYACVADDALEYSKDATHSIGGEQDVSKESFSAAAVRLGVCVLGIQVSYVLWGLLQERIMTKPYETGELFKSSKFLVFANRILAFFAAYTAMRITGEPVNRSSKGTPLYKFSFSSVSNIMSSVCQYEALKYVSFPTQVLAKSCKMVPVMLMGYVVSRRVHTAFEYLVALAVTCGVMIFKLYETNDAPVKNTELYGIILIVGYMGTDSFTSNWQSKVFKQYKVSSTAMMLYANLFSSAFTALSLLVTLEISHVYEYLLHNPTCTLHIFAMAICSAVGQLFIFYTVKTYGPLIFATIQTVRQFLSVIFSILFFAHPINGMMAFGICIVFAALGGQIFDKWRARSRSAKKPLPSTPPTEMVCRLPSSDATARTVTCTLTVSRRVCVMEASTTRAPDATIPKRRCSGRVRRAACATRPDLTDLSSCRPQIRATFDLT